MRAKLHGGLVLVVGCLLLTPAALISTAQANTVAPQKHKIRVVAFTDDHSSNSKHSLSKSGKARYARTGGVSLQCVTFARATSGIALKGNAANWWDAAAGVYQRGSEPEPGSVLNFHANGHMRLGHVAVVTQVLSSREIEIDHANWAWSGATKGNVSRGVRVLDVSAGNDWSAVRVGLGHGEDFGSIYPTYGFIYDRPDSGTLLANTSAARAPSADRPALGLDEVAEAPAAAEFAPVALTVDAPDRGFR
jgi:surface antigen